MNGALQQGKSALFESAQGTMLDVDHGTYPFVTASNSSGVGVSAGSGVPSRWISQVIGVAKAYTTRVGAGPLPTEILDKHSPAYEQFGEVAATTGRVRRVGWLDLELVKTVSASTPDTAIITNLAVSYTSPQATGTLTFTTVSNAYGVATVTVRVLEELGRSSRPHGRLLDVASIVTGASSLCL